MGNGHHSQSNDSNTHAASLRDLRETVPRMEIGVVVTVAMRTRQVHWLHLKEHAPSPAIVILTTAQKKNPNSRDHAIIYQFLGLFSRDRCFDTMRVNFRSS